MAVRTVWVGYDEYVFALKSLQALFRSGLPSPAALQEALAYEQRNRHVLAELGDQERADLAVDHLFELAWFQDHAVELIRFALYGQINWISLAVVAGCTILFMIGAILAYDPSRGLARRGPGGGEG